MFYTSSNQATYLLHLLPLLLQEPEDLSQLGSAQEPEARKRQRIEAMLAKLPSVWASSANSNQPTSGAANDDTQQAAAAVAPGAGTAEGQHEEAAQQGQAAEAEARDKFVEVVAAAVEQTLDAGDTSTGLAFAAAAAGAEVDGSNVLLWSWFVINRIFLATNSTPEPTLHRCPRLHPNQAC